MRNMFTTKLHILICYDKWVMTDKIKLSCVKLENEEGMHS